MLCDHLLPSLTGPGAGSSKTTRTATEFGMEKERNYIRLAVLRKTSHLGRNVKLQSNLTVKNVLCFGETQLEIISVALPSIATRGHCGAVDNVQPIAASLNLLIFIFPK